MIETEKQNNSFAELVEVVKRLRSPRGCPWDRKQTYETIRPLIIEEVYEVLEASEKQDKARLKEELGDLLMQILFHADLAREEGSFDIFDVVDGLKEKMVRRHPHVFGGKKRKGAGEVLAFWEKTKKAEGGSKSVMSGVPGSLPALLRAWRVQKKAARVGFDWKRIRPVWKKWEEEVREFKESLPKRRKFAENELGDILFTLVNIARFLKINPEDALQRATNRFLRRFRYMEKKLEREKKSLENLSLETMNRYWKMAKKAER